MDRLWLTTKCERQELDLVWKEILPKARHFWLSLWAHVAQPPTSLCSLDHIWANIFTLAFGVKSFWITEVAEYSLMSKPHS